MRVTILGANGPYPAPGGACSGYLLSEGDTRVILDLGLGCMANLFRVADIREISGAVLSHLHFDHMSDALNLGVARAAKKLSPIPVYAPLTPEPNRALFPDAKFEMKFSIGEIDFELIPARHPVEAYMIRATAGGKTLVYTGDTNYFEGIADAWRGADLVISDAAFIDADWSADKPHLSAGLAAKIAMEAGVGELVLTHLFPENDPRDYLNDARREFPKATLASIGEIYQM